MPYRPFADTNLNAINIASRVPVIVDRMIFSIIIILNFVVLVELNKENLGDVSTLKGKSWVDVQKRLNIGSKQDRYGCRNSNLNSTIIMARASLNNGASHFPSPSVSSAHECASACCDIQECNVAVYKLKVNCADVKYNLIFDLV